MTWPFSQLINWSRGADAGLVDSTIFLDKGWGTKGWWRAVTVYPQPYHHWQWACKYYPVLPNLLHNGALTHLPEAPTFTSGFAGAWVGVAASRKVLIYKADSGLVQWARWPKGLRSHWPEEARGLWSLSGAGCREVGAAGEQKAGKRNEGDSPRVFFFFLTFFFFFSLPYFFSLSLKKPWWEFH